MTTQEYARCARYAVDKYADYTGNVDEPESVLADLLTDLRHYADEEGIDFKSALQRAANRYFEEADNGIASTTETL